MRIISGTMRGTKLYSLDGLSTRPTLDRVKESLFNIINFKLENSIILDLFSGSGALALESLSRGAKKAVLCDSNFQAIKVINSNIEKTRTKLQTVVLNCNYEKALENISKNNMKFDIIFLDPPYKSNMAEDAVKIILNNNLLKDDGIIIIETDIKEKVIDNLQKVNINIYDERKYGRVTLLFLRKE